MNTLALLRVLEFLLQCTCKNHVNQYICHQFNNNKIDHRKIADAIATDSVFNSHKTGALRRRRYGSDPFPAQRRHNAALPSPSLSSPLCVVLLENPSA
jgi:hypothetical protein